MEWIVIVPGLPRERLAEYGRYMLLFDNII